jgi:hypothetical protein
MREISPLTWNMIWGGGAGTGLTSVDPPLPAGSHLHTWSSLVSTQSSSLAHALQEAAIIVLFSIIHEILQRRIVWSSGLASGLEQEPHFVAAPTPSNWCGSGSAPRLGMMYTDSLELRFQLRRLWAYCSWSTDFLNYDLYSLWFFNLYSK